MEGILAVRYVMGWGKQAYNCVTTTQWLYNLLLVCSVQMNFYYALQTRRENFWWQHSVLLLVNGFWKLLCAGWYNWASIRTGLCYEASKYTQALHLPSSLCSPASIVPRLWLHPSRRPRDCFLWSFGVDLFYWLQQRKTSFETIIRN